MKRLYVHVRVVHTSAGFTVALDDRPVTTPGRWPLAMPTHGLADAVAEEWRAQGTTVRPETMPLMQLAATVLDHIVPHRAAVETTVLRFAETDLVCYRADHPAELVRLQQAIWDPLVEWLAETYGVTLAVTVGVLPVGQSAKVLETLGRLLRDMDDWELAAFQAAAAASGSFVIALALIHGRVDAVRAFEAAELDASFEIDRWGADSEAGKRRAGVAFDLAAARRFHDLLED